MTAQQCLDVMVTWLETRRKSESLLQNGSVPQNLMGGDHEGAALWHEVLLYGMRYCYMLWGAALWHEVLLYVVGCCSMAQGTALWYGVLLHGMRCCSMAQGAGL